MGTTRSQLAQISGKITTYGKENLDEMLHAVGSALLGVFDQERVRIYLEDLTSGALSCLFTAGPYGERLRLHPFPIISGDAAVSQVFASRQPLHVKDTSRQLRQGDLAFAEEFSLGATLMLPLAARGKSIGVLCIDRDQPGAVLSDASLSLLAEFLDGVALQIDLARQHHQQLVLSRRVDQYKKREAAAFMVRSAVALLDRLALASVLVPVAGESGGESLAILASHARDPLLKAQYDQQGAVALQRGTSLISRYVNANAVITDEGLMRPLYIPDLSSHRLQQEALTREMALRSLYVVPRFDPGSRKVICLVNYFTQDIQRFSDFEMGLLQTHAEMVEQVITEVGTEHPEIKVLAEITDLLQERNERLQPFLSKVLSKATEIIGADTGSIAIVEEREGERWLVVEEEGGGGDIVGAKSKEWIKKYIPPFRVGGHELPPPERSLTGYVAWSKEPRIIRQVQEEREGEGFHRSMSDLIKSEIAVPMICDDEVIAVICLNSMRPDYFTEEHRRILQIIDRLASRHVSDIQQIEKLRGEVVRLKTDVGYKDPQVSSYRLGNIIGNSRKSQELVDFISTVSVPLFNRITLWHRNVLQEATIGLPSILVLGQTGAGKEFFFNNLYTTLNEMYRKEFGGDSSLPVKKTNIAAYSGDLTYSELFGHKKGAFTGAYSDRKGILEEAGGGIVFLDEIGDADPKTQVQLLRFLDNGGIVRLGDNVERFSRVLLVAATNKNLPEEIRKGNFREDLYHRLSELSVRVPSLNERREDIPDLAVHFLGKLFRTYRGKEEPKDEVPALTDEAKALLMNHTFRGNIRELRSILLRTLFFRSQRLIGADDIRRAIQDGSQETAVASPREELAETLASRILEEIAEGKDFWAAVYEPYSRSEIPRDTVRLVVERARIAAGGSMTRAARQLKAVGGDTAGDPEERKRLFKFKNFLYKTVKI
jgi:transcriptional regulator with GAF, ATPase, and Fis domain